MADDRRLLKRKSSTNPASGRQPLKRTKLQDARTLASQTSGKAFGNGELDVDKFVKAREFEISALDTGIKKSRSALSVRAFQSVPRELRRRTASHNVKRVPRRLRARAKIEMKVDKSPTVNSNTCRSNLARRGRLRLESARELKLFSERTRAIKAEKKQAKLDANSANDVRSILRNRLQPPRIPKAKFRKRQRFKAWLPTHLFHAKRAHMPPSKEPLWRMAIPLSPTQKCYRSTHRAASARGGMAWDTSYMSTIGLTGQESSILAAFKALNADVAGKHPTKSASWLRGTRAWAGWLFRRDVPLKQPIAPVSIIWRSCMQPEDASSGQAPTNKKPKRQAFIRIHPSAFLELWGELLKLSKVQKPAIAIEDLRFDIGSIEILGPAATEAIVGTLRPIRDKVPDHHQSVSPELIWSRLGSVSNAAQLPPGAAFGFSVADPRLHHPPKTVNTRLSTKEQENLTKLLASWPMDNALRPHAIFDRRSRILASRQLPSQKSINRRKGETHPGTYPEARPSDPRIPILAFVHEHGGRGQGKWVIMMPWKCVLPIWYSLMFYPLSTGGTIRFGGLEQSRQLSYEAGMPWFPGDYPGTDAGRTWELCQQQEREAAWKSRPKGRRIEWENTDIGRGRRGEIGVGWACDWNHLHRTIYGGDQTLLLPALTPPLPLWRLLPHSESIKTLRKQQAPGVSVEGCLTTINITMLQQGVVRSCARVYRLPTTDRELRTQWIAKSQAAVRTSLQGYGRGPKPAAGDPANVRRQRLAAVLLSEQSSEQVAASTPLVVPDEADLIGFVTTGNFNLSAGIATSIGSIALDQVVRPPIPCCVSVEEFTHERCLCIVRESGHGLGRLARWELV